MPYPGIKKNFSIQIKYVGHHDRSLICDDLQNLSDEEIYFYELNSINLGNSTNNLQNQISRSVEDLNYISWNF